MGWGSCHGAGRWISTPAHILWKEQIQLFQKGCPNPWKQTPNPVWSIHRGQCCTEVKKRHQQHMNRDKRTISRGTNNHFSFFSFMDNTRTQLQILSTSFFIAWLCHVTYDPVKFGWANVRISVYIHEGSSHLFWQDGAISQDTGMGEGLMCCLTPTFRIQISHWMCRCLFYGQAAFSDARWDRRVASTSLFPPLKDIEIKAWILPQR